MNPAITGGNVWSVGTIGPAGLEPGTGASPAGPSRTVSVNRTGAVKRARRHFLRPDNADFVSAIYILTPLLESSLRHVLKAHGHDVTIFDDASQTQQDRTISSLFEQMRAELDGIFTKAITADIENVFLTKPGPYLRHSLAHGLLHDGEPYGPDAIYGCWLIMRLCLIPLIPMRDRLRAAFDVV
jgi:hypothetical protein